jgi:hypothetical protein
MSSRSPRNVIVAQVERVPFAAHYEPLPIGREYRFLDAVQLCSGVTLRDLIERKEEGSLMKASDGNSTATTLICEPTTSQLARGC